MKKRAPCIKLILALLSGVTLPAGCGGAPGMASAPFGAVPGWTGPVNARPVLPGRDQSWMTPDSKIRAGPLLYVGNGENDVLVFSGFPKKPKVVGTLTGFEGPLGMCVDKRGDVFIANDGGSVDEYAHGGTTVLASYSTNGQAIGCSISARGDVAVTDIYRESGSATGQVCVWKGGKGNSTCYRDSAVCPIMYTFGYDDKGDLIGEGYAAGVNVCELPARASQMVQLSLSNFTIGYVAGTQWDGKYIALGDADVGGSTHQSGVWEVKLSDSTLTAVGSEIVFSDNCNLDYTDVFNPFFSASTNVTPGSTKRATRVVSPNGYCFAKDKPAVDAWAYPAGGMPTARLTAGLEDPSAVAISIAK